MQLLQGTRRKRIDPAGVSEHQQGVPATSQLGTRGASLKLLVGGSPLSHFAYTEQAIKLVVLELFISQLLTGSVKWVHSNWTRSLEEALLLPGYHLVVYDPSFFFCSLLGRCCWCCREFRHFQYHFYLMDL